MLVKVNAGFDHCIIKNTRFPERIMIGVLVNAFGYIFDTDIVNGSVQLQFSLIPDLFLK